jgi:adenylate cyclase, class 1
LTDITKENHPDPPTPRPDSPAVSPFKAGPADFYGRRAGYSDEALLNHGIRVFREYNKNKIDFLYEQLVPKKRIVYDLVPVLLHLDGRGLLGDDKACEMSLNGVYGFELTPRIREAFDEAFPHQGLPRLRYRAGYDPQTPIKSLMLIGSLGSIAQNPKSDFDYIVLVDAGPNEDATIRRFRRKLEKIERWAMAFAGAEVHFFPIDIRKFKTHDFGRVEKDNSGSTQGKLLVEELYRSLTLITGKIPIWWAMPAGVDDEEYDRLARLAVQSPRIDDTRLIDTGNVYNISLDEFYGAAIWHINKTIGSPFKSVLKLGVLEDYLMNQGRTGLLCDELKARLQHHTEDLRFLDHYLLLFDRVSRYMISKGRFDRLDLLRRSLYMKSGAKLTSTDRKRINLPRKKMIMLKKIEEWNWDQTTLNRLNNHRFWSFKETREFSDEVNSFIMETYRRVITEKNRCSREVDPGVDQHDLHILGRKLFVFYSRRPGKVDSIRNVIEQPAALYGVTLQSEADDPDGENWSAYRGFLSQERIRFGSVQSLQLTRSTRLSGIMIWLVNNQLYDHMTSIHLNQGADNRVSYCTVPDLHRLARRLAAFFPVLNLYRLRENDLLKQPRVTRAFLVLNMEQPENPDKILQADLITQTTWGEIFFKTFESPFDVLLELKQVIVEDLEGVDPSKAVEVFIPPRQFRRRFIPDLNRTLGYQAVRTDP